MKTEEIKKSHLESQSPNDDTLKDMYESQMESHTAVTLKAVIEELITIENTLIGCSESQGDKAWKYTYRRIETLKQELKQLEERK